MSAKADFKIHFVVIHFISGHHETGIRTNNITDILISSGFQSPGQQVGNLPGGQIGLFTF